MQRPKKRAALNGYAWLLSGFRTMICAYMLVFSAITISGCGSKTDTALKRIALLAPFEGRYSEIGYDAYYAARLAIQEHGNGSIELLAVEDGGSSTSARERAYALARDPLVKVVIALGQNATAGEVQQAFGNTVSIIVGDWNSKPGRDTVYMLSSEKLGTLLTPLPELVDVADADAPDTPIVGSELFALQQFAMTSKHVDHVTVVSSGALPDPDFRTRYRANGQYVPEPGLLASLTYDAVGMALAAIDQEDVSHALATIDYHGINGEIQFVNGYWVKAPIHYYRYGVDHKLMAIDSPIK